MVTIEKDELENLENGRFNILPLKNWFSNYAFSYIDASVKGCDKKMDVKTLSTISLYAQKYMVKTGASRCTGKALKRLILSSGIQPTNLNMMSREGLIDFWDERVALMCEHTLKGVISVANRHLKVYGDVLNQVATNTDPKVRLYCCANGNYEAFLNDDNPRIKKVAEMRREFAEKWKNLGKDDYERQMIVFLAKGLKDGDISCWNGDAGYEEEDLMFAIICSRWFKNFEVWFPAFDTDLAYTIGDKRLLAEKIYQFIQEGKITIMPGVGPKKSNSKDGDRTLRMKKIGE